MDPIMGTGTRAAQVTCPLPVSPPRVPSPQGEGRPVAEDGGHRCSGTQPGSPRGRAVRPLPQGFPPPVPALQLQVGSWGHQGTPGDTGGHRGTWGRRARVAQPSPHPLLLAGCARARCATRAPWTWASRGGAACSATSRGTRRLREPRGGAVPLRLGARGLRAAPGTPGFGAEMFSARPARGEGNKPGPASPAPPVWSVRRQHGGGGQGDGGTGVSEPSPWGLSFSGVSQALPRPGVEGS